MKAEGDGPVSYRLVSWRLSQVGREEWGSGGGRGMVRIGPVVKIRGLRVGVI